MVQGAIDGLGGLDIIVSNAGWTKFTNFGDLDALTEAEWDKVRSSMFPGEIIVALT
ncbi:MAG: hypothetical protein Q9183_001571 [Haloplaca sp. 2 TL-2023]